MGRGPQHWTEELVTRRLYGEKLGSGELSDYRPWLSVRDLSSKGRQRRVFGHKTGRVHHLMSDVEWYLFLLLEWAPDVVDIREQFPLDRTHTTRIAKECGIRHPRYPVTQVCAVMSADFVVTRVKPSGQRYLEAYNTKCETEMTSARSVAKLEIQRRYFEEQGIPHYLILDTDLREQKPLLENLAWIRATPPAKGEDLPAPEFFEEQLPLFLRALALAPNQLLHDFCLAHDATLGFDIGTSLRMAGIALWKRLLNTDLKSGPVSHQRTRDISVRNDFAAEERRAA